MAKVFIVSDGGHDYSDAERFGELVYCTEGVIRKDDIAQMYRELSHTFTINNMQPGDYLLISSLASLCSVAAAIIGAQFGEIHFLLYKDGQYVSRDLILED